MPDLDSGHTDYCMFVAISRLFLRRNRLRSDKDNAVNARESCII